MTITLDYKLIKRPTPLEPTKSPYAKVVLSGPKERLQVVALLDSGADTCAIPAGIAEIIGLKLSEKTAPVIGVGGKMDATVSKVSISIEGPHEKYQLHDVPVNVLPSPAGDGIPVILGRAGFFEAFEITFKEKSKKVVLKKV